MIFEIKPYLGATPLNFGITEAEVVSILGPRKFSACWFPKGIVESSGDGISVALDANRALFQVGFTRNFDGTLLIDGMDVFRDHEIFSKLLMIDDSPLVGSGFVFLFKLGMRLGGFHETAADEGKTISLFQRGRYQIDDPNLVPFDKNGWGTK